MRNKRDTAQCAGFEMLYSDVLGRDGGLLVPTWVKHEHEQGGITPAKAEPVIPDAPAPSVTVPLRDMPLPGANDLASLLPVDDDLVLERTRTLAARVLKPHLAGLDTLSVRFCNDVFAAAALHELYSTEFPTWGDVLSFLQDPAWDSTKQIVSSFQYDKKPPRTTAAGRWIVDNMQWILRLSDSSL